MGEGTREGTAGGGTGGGVTGGSPQVTEWAGMALGGATRRRGWRGGGHQEVGPQGAAPEEGPQGETPQVTEPGGGPLSH